MFEHTVEKLLQENIYSRYRDEYQMLVTNKHGVEQENVEVNIDASTIQFLISLKVDCTSLPEYIQPVENDHTIWYNPLSPRLEQVLGNSRNMVLPEYKKDMILVDYVALVLKMIDNRIGIVADHFKMKKIYIMSLTAVRNRDIIEYDTETYNKAVFMYNVNDYYCLVTVNIGVKFPQEKPSVQLSSIYCQEGKQCTETLDKYPYNPTHRPDDNIDNLLQFLNEAVLKFKNHKH
ncbi:hypothetical protein NQ314_012566 [Rhamnusium bicolor]|uniref:BRISC and BRCA1-A complex member 2 n=1 Tax=Rhamnusium bicolor TaxID=1586634 RepID=A0AAV8XBT9_9CUCU|nr:hypothetical protein NQ314_012566 [Rhamnusium bicolor]